MSGKCVNNVRQDELRRIHYHQGIVSADKGRGMQAKGINKKTFASIVILTAIAVFCHAALVWGTPLLKTEKAVYKSGETVKVFFSGAPGSNADWICIAPAGSPDTDAGNFKYMPGGVSQGSLVFDSPAPGKYEARAYYNYRTQGYTVSARYAFSVEGGGQVRRIDPLLEKKYQAEVIQKNLSLKGSPPVKTEKVIYKSGETIKVLFSGAPGSNADWICIVPDGSPDTDAGDFKYMPGGVSQGSLVFDPPAPGKYEVRAYYNYRTQGYAVSARYAFFVGNQDETGNIAALPPEKAKPETVEPLPENKEQTDNVAALPEKKAAPEIAVPVPEKTAEPEIAATVPEKKAEPEIVRLNIPPSGYTLEYAPVVSGMIAGTFDAALELADRIYRMSQAKGGAKQDRYLKLLERGKVALAARKYDQCIADLQEAEKRFLTIEGTVSITEGLGSLVTDDTVAEYEPEMHEKLLIPPYLVLAYLGRGDFDGARVERNKTINKIHQYIEENQERAYLENPFARLLSAVVYEMDGKYDDAKIEYRKMKRDDEVARLENRKGKTSDLVIFVDVGMAPEKYEVKYGPATVVAGGGSVTMGFTYAAYNAMQSAVENCAINIDGKPAGNTNNLYNLEKTIFAQYESNKSAMMAKLTARMTAKVAAQVAAQMVAEEALKNVPFGGLFAKVAIGVASRQWIAAEKADLRSWVTLPRQIQYVRINELKPGEHTIVIEYNGGFQTQKVTVKEGKISVAYFSAAK